MTQSISSANPDWISFNWSPRLVKMPVPMMLEITIEHAVRKPMLRLGGADLAAAGWVSVVIRRESIQLSYSGRPDIQGSMLMMERKVNSLIQSVFTMLC